MSLFVICFIQAKIVLTVVTRFKKVKTKHQLPYSPLVAFSLRVNKGQ